MGDVSYLKIQMWAFIGGFLFCYLLIGNLKSQRTAPKVVAMRPVAARLVLPAVPEVEVTNFRLPQVRIELPPRGLDQPDGLLHDVRRPGYSLDLIDTRHQLPGELPERE